VVLFKGFTHVLSESSLSLPGMEFSVFLVDFNRKNPGEPATESYSLTQPQSANISDRNIVFQR
jgi:hypothetical protein